MKKAVYNELDLDSNNYNKTIFDKDSKNWQSAMKVEMESIYSNHVWKLVELPVNIKSISGKWVYKRKRGPDDSVETFKVRLVVKEFTKKRRN